MDQQQIKQAIESIEQAADEAKKAVQSGNVPQDLRQQIESFHQQASQAKHAGSADESVVLKLEESADKMKAACQQAGSNVNPQLQQAVQRAHDEASRAKKQIQAGSPA